MMGLSQVCQLSFSQRKTKNQRDRTRCIFFEYFFRVFLIISIIIYFCLWKPPWGVDNKMYAVGGARERGKLQKLAIIDNRHCYLPYNITLEITPRTSEAMTDFRFFSQQTFVPFYKPSLGIKFILHQRTLHTFLVQSIRWKWCIHFVQSKCAKMY